MGDLEKPRWEGGKEKGDLGGAGVGGRWKILEEMGREGGKEWSWGGWESRIWRILREVGKERET